MRMQIRSSGLKVFNVSILLSILIVSGQGDLFKF